MRRVLMYLVIVPLCFLGNRVCDRLVGRYVYR